MARKRKKSNKNTYRTYYWLSGFIFFIALLFFFRALILRNTIQNNIIEDETEEYLHLEALRSSQEREKIYSFFNKYSKSVFGLDISQHQGKIKWDSIQKIKKNIPISFIFVRATIGMRNDKYFKKNWEAIKKKNIIRGAYHYYDTNKNSTEQAENFISTVTLESGDLPPVLDIEDLPKNQSLDLLKKGLLNWIKIVEQKYKVKPIIYSNDAYFLHHISDLNLDEFPIWVANYNPIENPIYNNWLFWQFTEKGIVKGFKNNFVDINVFNGNYEDLLQITIP